jgi:hypothetical protein
MRTIPSFSAVTVLMACGPLTLNPAKREFWLGGTDDKQARDEAAARLPAERDMALAYRDTFLLCMREYGTSHAKAKATATEIAGAAVSSCQEPLSSFERAARLAFRDTWTSGYSGEEPARRADSVSYSRTPGAVADLETRGRDVAIQAVVEGRPPQRAR